MKKYKANYNVEQEEKPGQKRKFKGYGTEPPTRSYRDFKAFTEFKDMEAQIQMCETKEDAAKIELEWAAAKASMADLIASAKKAAKRLNGEVEKVLNPKDDKKVKQGVARAAASKKTTARDVPAANPVRDGTDAILVKPDMIRFI